MIRLIPALVPTVAIEQTRDTESLRVDARICMVHRGAPVRREKAAMGG